MLKVLKIIFVGVFIFSLSIQAYSDSNKVEFKKIILEEKAVSREDYKKVKTSSLYYFGVREFLAEAKSLNRFQKDTIQKVYAVEFTDSQKDQEKKGYKWSIYFVLERKLTDEILSVCKRMKNDFIGFFIKGRLISAAEGKMILKMKEDSQGRLHFKVLTNISDKNKLENIIQSYDLNIDSFREYPDK